DVSPDGKTVVFDMLGDLYSMPMAGGEATPLTATISWEMQPRFSPDGKAIAYTSDAGGGDNIWIMDIDGSNARQVTKESFRLLNNPSWSPDGRFIVARKHFTSTRSLGAGEMWLYSVNGGGKGVRMNEAPTKQKDLGEPIFSPDGRYVYFSQDTTPGQIFQYSKDSNGIIYRIKRLDTQSGDIINFVQDAGGSVRPTPSPDGKWLAFVRRVRNQSSLFIKDLASGAEKMIFNDLERDMQETWAVHGVYPNMDWTPDSKAIVFWAKGKVHKLTLNTKNLAESAVAEIPFSVSHSRQVADAVRFDYPVFQETERTKMLRWVQVTPDQSQVVFQALGHIYVRNLKSGELKQLTKGNDAQAFYPNLSSDGKSVVYVSWNDQELGKIRVIPLKGGKAKTLVSEPGHYLAPRFVEGDKAVVYQKTRGGRLFTPNWSFDPGLYRVGSSGKGKATLLTINGSGVQSSVDGRYYLTQVEGSGLDRKTKLMAFDPKTMKSQHVAETHFGSEFNLSPDGKWLAFVEGFDVYVAPFRPSGKVIQLSSKKAALPIVKVSDDVGENVHWAGDSKTLYWSLGETLYSKVISNELFMADDKGTPAKTQAIGFEFKNDKPKHNVALTGARIITMEGDEVYESGTILIKNNKIEALGADISVPKGYKAFDMSGKTIIPGLIEPHWHGSFAQNEIVPRENWGNFASLAFGVTTLHDPSNDTSEVFAAAEMARAGLTVAPRIYSTGRIIYGAKASIFAEINNLDDARKHVKRMKVSGATSVKSYNQPRRDQRQQVLKAAREENILVVPEGGSLFQHNMNMIVDGHTGIEHAIPVAKVYDDVKQLWSQTKVGYTPTLNVGYGGIWGENYWYQHTNVWQHPILSGFVPPSILQPRSVRRPMAPEEDYNHFEIARTAKQLHDLGVELHIGGHGQREGLGSHWEMWMFAQGGMTPLEALATGTINSAKYLGLDNEIGSIKVGKLADLAILDSNPLENIYATDKVHAVMLNGRLYDSKTMRELTGNWQPKPMYWLE
ncbi:MAG: amidohydrolase family protein, partial [Enterobacterales bacterium]|nr:amidohydrolase family protein [Enterobacterales bacterium]